MDEIHSSSFIFIHIVYLGRCSKLVIRQWAIQKPHGIVFEQSPQKEVYPKYVFVKVVHFLELLSIYSRLVLGMNLCLSIIYFVLCSQ